MIYFDNAATTQVSEEAAAAALKAMRENYANPSAAYSFGTEAKRELEGARADMAKILSVKAEEIHFTSCATESNNEALKGIMYANKHKGRRLLYSAVEHPAIAETAAYMKNFEGCEAEIIPVDNYGRVKPDALEHLLQKPTVLVCVQLVNNELGTIQPVREIAELAHKYGAYLLVDGVQGFGKIDFKMHDLGADAFSLSGHKLHAPKGIGVLWLSEKVHCRELLSGGGQENKRRSGTENMPAVMALRAAACEAHENIKANYEKCLEIKNTLWNYIKENIPEVRKNSPEENTSPYILSVSFADTKSEVLLHYLEQYKIFVSAGSACSTHKNALSGKNPVLVSCGLEDKWTTSCLRFSFSEYNTAEDALEVGRVLKKAVEEIRMLMK